MNKPPPSPHMPRRRVMIVEPAGLLWGSERALIDLLSRVPADQYDLSVVCPTRTPLADILRNSGYRVIEGPIGLLHRRGTAARLRALVWLGHLIRRERPDVLHLNQAGLTRLAAAACRPLGTPLISHVRLLEDAELLRRLMPGSFSPDICVAISTFIETALTAGSDGNTTKVSGSEKTTALNSVVELIYDPFDVEAFAAGITDDATTAVRTELGLSGYRRLVLIVGRICPEKGQDLFVEAARRLHLPDVTFAVVGGVTPESLSDAAFAKRLRERAAQSQNGNQVKFLGERKDIAHLMNASNLVVLASRNEPFGRVLLEALSLRVPVVGPDRGGPLEIIGANQRGFLFESGNAQSLADAMWEALTNLDVARVKADHGRAWVARVCSPDIHSERIQSVWNRASQWRRR